MYNLPIGKKLAVSYAIILLLVIINSLLYFKQTVLLEKMLKEQAKQHEGTQDESKADYSKSDEKLIKFAMTTKMLTLMSAAFSILIGIMISFMVVRTVLQPLRELAGNIRQNSEKLPDCPQKKEIISVSDSMNEILGIDDISSQF